MKKHKRKKTKTKRESWLARLVTKLLAIGLLLGLMVWLPQYELERLRTGQTVFSSWHTLLIGFEILLWGGAFVLLVDRFRRPHADFRKMTGLEFENYVAKCLRFDGYSHIKVTKSSGDYGVDITARKGGHSYAIQCKLYHSPVGVHAVQEVAAGMRFYDCNYAIVITNSTFTPAAEAMANKLGVRLIGNYK